jgi:hypothetical protein
MTENPKIERIRHANEVLDVISSHGRRFFYSKTYDRVARFSLTDTGRIQFTDDYIGEPFEPKDGVRWKHFSHGGTMRALIESLTNYIRTGEPIANGYFGPWKEWIAGGDLWGYGEAMKLVRAGIMDSPAVRPFRSNPDPDPVETPASEALDGDEEFKGQTP